jgi:formylglycine-generating enzyme
MLHFYRRPHRWVLIAAGLLAITTVTRAVAAESPLGVVATQPSEGPFVVIDGGFMGPYAATIPGTEITFEMIPVIGGECRVGSPASEPGRNADEGPQKSVRVEPFWIGKCEVTWAEYHAYMKMYEAFKQFQTLTASDADASSGGDVSGADVEAMQLIGAHAWNGDVDAELDVDAVTSPTPLYDPSTTYSAGEEENQPAVTMTQFAARQYTKWLSGITGREYRLPGEMEWECAARAGTTTAYSFGNDASELDRFAWHDGNADYATHPVGTKEPNAWGLHDMHGNAAEWTLDEYAADRYGALSGEPSGWESIFWPTQLYPRVIRGGSWQDQPESLRSAARRQSEEVEWKLSDPNRPRSPWWYTEEPAMGVGMRLVRGLRPLAAVDRRRVWEADVDELRSDVKGKLKEGRGTIGKADQSLPAAVEAAAALTKEQ